MKEHFTSTQRRGCGGGSCLKMNTVSRPSPQIKDPEADGLHAPYQNAASENPDIQPAQVMIISSTVDPIHVTRTWQVMEAGVLDNAVTALHRGKTMLNGSALDHIRESMLVPIDPDDLLAALNADTLTPTNETNIAKTLL